MKRPLTGVLLVGGASRRFGSPKALVEVDGERLVDRGNRVLAEVCDEVLVVGKPGELPFDVLPDAGEVRAPIAASSPAYGPPLMRSSSSCRSTVRG